jgi:hypothetical protein
MNRVEGHEIIIRALSIQLENWAKPLKALNGVFCAPTEMKTQLIQT